MGDSKVIALRPRAEREPKRNGLPRGPVTIGHEPRPCQHRQCVIYEDTQELVCDACQKQIDPYWFIRRISRDWDSVWERAQRYEAAAKEAYEKAKRDTAPLFRRRRVMTSETRDGQWVLTLNCGHTVTLPRRAAAPAKTNCYACGRPQRGTP